MLTEQEISRTWRSLFRRSDCNEEVFAKAEQLLEELGRKALYAIAWAPNSTELRQRAGSRGSLNNHKSPVGICPLAPPDGEIGGDRTGIAS